MTCELFPPILLFAFTANRAAVSILRFIITIVVVILKEEFDMPVIDKTAISTAAVAGAVTYVLPKNTTLP